MGTKIKWVSVIGVLAGSSLALFAYWFENVACICPGGFSCPHLCVHPDESSVITLSALAAVVSVFGLIYNHQRRDKTRG